MKIRNGRPREKNQIKKSCFGTNISSEFKPDSNFLTFYFFSFFSARFSTVHLAGIQKVFKNFKQNFFFNMQNFEIECIFVDILSPKIPHNFTLVVKYLIVMFLIFSACILTKILMFQLNSILEPNLDCCPKFRFFIKIWIFVQTFDFWPTFRFLTKIPIFDQNSDF